MTGKWTLWMAALALAAAPALAIEEAEPAAASAGSPASMEAPNVGATPSGHVVRSAFTRAVVDREPQDEVTTLEGDVTEIFYFTEIRDMQGKTVIHRWEYDGQVASEVAFDIGGPRWRVYSSKSLDPAKQGQWTVKVVDVDGNAMREESFTYAGMGNAGEARSLASEASDVAPPAAPAD